MPDLEPQTVLLLGASNLTYSEDGRSLTLVALIEDEIGKRLPASNWRCEARPLFYGPRMVDAAEAQTKRIKPAAVVVSLLAWSFATGTPMGRIRARWPALYPSARAIADRLKKAAGGTDVKTPRGWIFKAPRWLVLQLVGSEPEVDVNDAVRSSIETLDALVRLEGPLVICAISLFVTKTKRGEAEAVRRRLELFKTSLEDHCRLRHIALYDRTDQSHNRSPADADYAGLETRRYEASLIAGLLASSFGSEGGKSRTR